MQIEKEEKEVDFPTKIHSERKILYEGKHSVCFL